MLFDDKSPLRNLPAGLTRKQILFMDGIRYSVGMTTLAYYRLRVSTTELTKGLAAGTQTQNPSLFTAALSDAWTIIDSTHRLRELVWDMPGITKKKRSAPLRKFYRSTENIDQLRNKVQHLKGEIRTVADTDQPVWGVLSWFSHFEEQPDIVRRCQLAAGTLFPSAGPAFKLEGVSLAPPVDRFELTAHGIRVSLTDTYEAVERVARSIEEALGEGLKALPQEAESSGSDLLACIEIRLGPEGKEPLPSG
jgi:hypothetical protein